MTEQEFMSALADRFQYYQRKRHPDLETCDPATVSSLRTELQGDILSVTIHFPPGWKIQGFVDRSIIATWAPMPSIETETELDLLILDLVQKVLEAILLRSLSKGDPG